MGCQGLQKRGRRFFSVLVGAAGVLLSGSDELYAQGRIESISRFPALSIKEFQNSKFPGSVMNDRKMLLGSVGSDLWRGASDAPGEFWMLTDRACLRYCGWLTARRSLCQWLISRCGLTRYARLLQCRLSDW